MATGTKFIKDYINSVDAITKQLITTEEVSKIDYKLKIQEAVVQYSKDRPRDIRAVDTAGNGGSDYTLPTTFEDGFSQIIKVEFPTGEQVPLILDPELTMIYDNGTSKKLRFLVHKPSSGDKFGLTHTARHTLTETSSTIADADFDAVALLAASKVSLMLAVRFARTRDSFQSADVINFRTKSDDYKGLAETLEKEYKKLMKIEGGTPSQVVFDIDTQPSFRYPWLTHLRR